MTEGHAQDEGQKGSGCTASLEPPLRSRYKHLFFTVLDIVNDIHSVNLYKFHPVLLVSMSRSLSLSTMSLSSGHIGHPPTPYHVPPCLANLQLLMNHKSEYTHSSSLKLVECA